MRHEGTGVRGKNVIALLQYGPCWCRGVPGDDGSFDFVRTRTVHADLGALPHHLVIVTDRILGSAASMCRRMYDAVPEPKLLISTAACPSAERFWRGTPVDWVPIEQVLEPDLRIDACISGQPESLLAAVLSASASGLITQDATPLAEAVAS